MGSSLPGVLLYYENGKGMEKCAVKKCGGRVLSLDLLKLFAIYLVLYGHCVQQFLTAPAVENGVYSTIYSFHMPLFMMISGYFSASSIRLEAKEFFKKKVVGLLLPVFSWSVILFLLMRVQPCRFSSSEHKRKHGYEHR